MIILIDIINTTIQVIIINYILYYFLNKSTLICKIKDINKPVLGSIIMFFLINFITRYVSNSNLSLILMTVFMVFIVALIYRKSYKQAILSYCIAYFFIQVPVILSSSILFPVFNEIFPNSETAKLLGIYAPGIICELVLILNIKRIYIIYKELSRYRYYLELCIFTIISLDYVICLSMAKLSWGSNVLSKITIFTFVIFISMVVLYIKNLNYKYDEVEKLNVLLVKKNDELKKIKHDYGSQISYINGLYIMNQYERLGNVLQDIIHGNESISSNIKYMSSNDSIISNIVNSIDIKNIHVIIEEEVNLDKIGMNEYELHKIMSNIINNAVTAIGDEGLITIKTYKMFDSVYISVKNNGPQISEDIIDRLFDLGFTTNNSDKNNHGYGLFIVKELVESNNGKIYVKSNKDYTEFKIIFKEYMDTELETGY